MENDIHMFRPIYLAIPIGIIALALLAKTLMRPAPAPSSEKTTLVTSRWAGPHADLQRTLLDRYETTSGVKVIQDAIPYAQLRSKQTLNMANTTGEFDLVWVQESWMEEYVKSGYLLPLNQYFETVEGFDIARYMPGLVKLNTYNGKVYGIPTMLQTAIVAFDRRALEKANLAPPETWSDMLKVARYFKAKGSGIAIPARKGMFDDNIWESLMYSNGGSYLDQQGRPSLNSAENVEALQFYQALMTCALKGSLNWHVDDANKQLQFGLAPIGITISGLAGILEDPSQSKIAGHVGYRPLPYSKRPAGTLSIWNWCIPADCKNPREAFRLLAWLTSPAIEKEQSLANGQLSAVSALFEDREMKQKLPFLPALVPYMDKPHTPLAHIHGRAVVETMMEALFRVSVSKVKPEEELATAQKQIMLLFSQPGGPANR